MNNFIIIILNKNYKIHFILFFIFIMSKNKNTKKTNYHLKFELSSINLSCFINKKSTSIT